MANQIRFDVGFNVNKTGLNELQNALVQIQAEVTKASNTGNLTQKLKESSNAARQLSDILNQSWNSKLGQLDLSKVNNGIKEAFGSVSNLKTKMEQSGPAGSAAYNQVASAILNTNLQLKQSNKLLDEMAVSMANTVKWGITSNIFNNITGSIQKAYGYTKNLDSSLNDIRIVTDKSAESMEKFAKQANSAAKGLGASTLDYTQASLIYYQQGLSDEDVAARAETTLKAANVTGQSGEEVSEQLTAVWNGYKVTAQEAELYVDKLAAVAADTAADLEELSTGMSKVASAASLMGVDIDQLNAQLATIVSVTRQAPESVGTALKTIYARMGDIEAGLDTETTLGHYTEEMANMGFNVLDMNGHLRDMGEVIEEIGSKWSSMSREQQISLSQTVAGTRQYNNLLALFDNWDMYTNAIETSANAAGTLQHQQDIYMESTKAHLKELSTEAEKTYDILFDQDTVNGFADALTGALGVFNNFIEGVGGGGKAFIALGGIIANVFSKQIGTAFNNQLINMEKARDNADAFKIKQDVINAHILKGDNIQDDSALNKEVEIAQNIFSVQQLLSSEEYNQLTTLQQEVGLRESQISYLSQYKDIAMEIFDTEHASVHDFEERLELEEASLEEHENRLAFLDRELNLYDQLKDDENYTLDDTEDLFNRIKGLQALAASEEDSLLLEEAASNIASRQNLTEEQRKVIIDTQNSLLEEQQRNINLVRQGLDGVQAAQNGTLSRLREESDARQGIIAQQIRQAQQQQIIQQAVQGATALFTIGTSLVGVIQTLNNEDLSFEEKLTQSMTVLLTMLPMVINNLDGIKAIIPGVKIGLTQLVATYDKGQAAISASNALMTGSTLGFKASIKALLPVLGNLLVTIAPYAAIVSAVVAVTWLAVKAYNADADAAKKAAEAHKDAAEAAQEARVAYEELANTMSEYKELADGIKELDESTQEYKDSLEQANEKAMELIRSNKELAQYAKRNDQGLITFEGNEDKVDEILKQEKRKKDLALGAESLAEIEKNKAQLKSDTTDFMRSTNISFTGSESDYNSYILEGEPLQKLISEIAKSDLNGLTKDDLASMNSIDDLGLNGEEKDNLISAILAIEPEIMDIAEQTRAINATESLLLKDTLAKGLEDSEKYTELSEAEKNAVLEIYGNEEKLTEEVKNDIKEKAEEKIKEDYKNGIFGSGKETELHDAYAEARGWELSKNKAGDKAIYVDKEGNEHTIDDDSARAYLKNLKYTDLLADYDEKLKESAISVVEKISNFGEGTFDEQTASELLGFANGKDIEFNANTMSLETFNKLQEMSANGGIEEALSGVTADEWDALGYKNAKAYAAAINEALTPELKKSIIESAKQSIIGLSDDIGTLTKDFQAGDVTSENIKENEEYQNIIKNLDDIKTLYPELTTAAETFANTNLVGTQMWTESLYELQDAINEIELKDLREQLTEARDAIYTDKEGNKVEFEAWLKSDEFESELDAILNADYAISVEIHSQAEEAFDDITAAIANMEEQAGKIGDDYIVAAEDIRELNNAFPGILANIESLHDGTVQLNEETVKSAMAAAQSEIAADAEATNEKLQNSANELRAKQKTYQAMADAAYALATGEMEAGKEEADYKKTIEEGLSKLNKEATQTEMDNDALVATNSNTNAEILATNWSNAYQEASKSAIEFANVAASAADVAKSGDISKLYQGDFSVNYTGNTGTSSEASQIQQYQDLFESGDVDYAKLAQSFQEAADAFGQQANDVEGMMVESGALIEGITKGIKGVASGKGIDNKKDNKDKRDEEYKNKEDEIDRYWELNKAIEAVTEELSDLDKKQEKLYGKELIASLKAENELLEQQAERYRALAAEQQREASELQGLLSAYGVVFDAQGGVTNYLAASQAALDRYNQAVAAYNAFLIDEATFKAEQRAYENFKSLLDRYEALYYEEMRETQNKLDEIHRQELENNLKAWEVEIQLKLDMSEMERQWEDFFKDINENFKLVYEDLDATMQNLADKMKTYQGGDGDIATTLKAIKDVQAEIDKMMGGGESDMFESVSQAQEKLKELNEQLQDSALAMKELWEEAWDTYLEGIDQAADQLDDLMERYDNINEQIEYQKELIELLYGEEAYDLMDKYYETQQKNTMSEIDSLKQQADLWKQQYEEALAIDEANGTMSEDTQKFYELWQEAQEELNGKVIDYIDLLQNDYKNAIAGVISDLEKSLTGGSTLDDVKEQWELLQEQADKYYDDVERIYEISNLAGKYETSIANTSELKNQQKLQELYDREMEYLENKKYLTEYDLEVANARYDMALKQIALEEAQQNKNAMKLVRGADGNWSYQYVADEDDIASKQQALLDAANEYYRITKEGYHENLEDMMNAQATYLEKLQEINEIYINDEEMRAQKAQELYEMYYGEGGILTLLYTENEERRTNMADATLQSLTTFYAIDEENYTRMTEVERELIDGLKDGTLDNYDEMLEKAKEVCGETLDAWTSSAQEIANQWYKDGGDSVKAQIIQAYKDMELANKSYQDAVAALEKAVEQNFGEEGITGALNDAQKETEELDDKTEELCDNAESNLDRYRDAVNQIGEAWEAVKDQIQDAINLVNEYLNLVGSGGSDSSGGSGDPGSGGGTSPSPGSGGGSGDGQLSVGETVTYTGGLYYYDSNGTAPSGSRGPGKQVKVTQIASGKPYPIHVQSNDSAYGWLKKEQLSGYDTGGYTGDWHGGDGRLALLHSKELVLNANDTENMLAAVNTVRQIANLGDSINQSIMNGISQMILGLTGLGNYGNYSIGETKESGDTIFEIQANFPNANDVESIREAIMSLPNLASQYIARNKK